MINIKIFDSDLLKSIKNHIKVFTTLDILYKKN